MSDLLKTCDRLDELAAKATERPWRVLKCRCGDPVCTQTTFAHQGSVGLDQWDADLVREALDALPALIAAARDMVKHRAKIERGEA